MAVKNNHLPFKPDPDANILEVHACLGDLIEWTLGQRMSQLKAAGVTDNDLMRLRRTAVRYQKGEAGFQDARLIWELMPMLDEVHITKRVDSL